MFILTPKKQCRVCGEEKLPSEFNKAKQNSDNLRTECRACDNARTRANYQANRERHIAGVRIWEEKNQEKLKLSKHDRYLRNIDRGRDLTLKRKYGISLSDYKEILERQGGFCAICRTNKEGLKGKVLYVDHDHKTGRVRGLLCNPCNVALGLIRDDISIALKMIEYLK